jgi:hypothetical protein
LDEYRCVLDEFAKDRQMPQLLISGRLHHLLDELLDRLASSLGSDYHAEVENQSHVGGFNGSRWLLIAASTSRAKASSSVAVEACSRARRGDSERYNFRQAGRSRIALIMAQTCPF